MKIISSVLLATLILTLTACSGGFVETDVISVVSQSVIGSGEERDTAFNTQVISADSSSPISVEYDHDDLDSSESSGELSNIRLDGDSITLEGSGATVNGNIITITSAGRYSINGNLNDGQVIVDTEDAETVVLVLNNANISSSTSAPIYIRNAEKTVITLAGGTENYVTDGAAYIFENAELDEPNAAVFSKDDLTINGDGSLIVTANYNNGIDSKDDLKITGGSITVNAVNDGIKGKDFIVIMDGNITITAGGDGMQSNNDDDSAKGYIAIENGMFNVIAGLDGIQAETRLNISAGDFTITSGGGSTNAAGMSSAESANGIKAGVDLAITGGTFNIDSVDDALLSNNSLTIDNGNFMLKSGDDGIHSEYSLTINGGDVSVLQSFEGLESAVITINDGNVHLVTSDDGLNATSGGGGGQVDGSYFYINGGYVLIDASGDGLDSNGTAIMTGGVVIVQGPAFQGNGPLDVNGEFEISGGFLIAAGSAGMPETPSTSSTQNSIALVLDSTMPGGTIIHIERMDGEDILTYESPKDFQLFVFSSPELQGNTTYNIFTGGDSTGTVTDGLYSVGTYTSGTQVASVEISSSVTTFGSFSNGPGGGKHP